MLIEKCPVSSTCPVPITSPCALTTMVESLSKLPVIFVSESFTQFTFGDFKVNELSIMTKVELSLPFSSLTSTSKDVSAGRFGIPTVK